jgi:glycosyltransferase involved in cell wall biosynthesis
VKILHLYSDWKWTGPAEPAIQACRSLMDCGHEVVFACSEPDPGYAESTKQKALAIGLDVTTRFALDRHCPPVRTLRDVLTLPGYIRRAGFDVLHCHLCHDHVLGGLCVKLLGRRRPAVVRSLYRRDILRRSLGYRLQLRQLTDGCVTFTDSFRRGYVERFRLPPDRVVVSPPSVDLERFSPTRSYRDMRAEFGVRPDAPFIGIVGRFQKYRRAEVFVQAAHRLASQEPEARFLIIGRSSQIQDTVIRPIEELGMRDRIVLAGYRIEDYADTLACLDIFTLLMPGFDGTARAVREAMALAKPCVVADYGMLPEIVPHEKAGLVVPAKPDALADGWLRLVRDPDARRALGAGARAHAAEHFRIDRVGPVLSDLYERLRGARPRAPRR